ncbi:MAG TPA: opioid growth factor receptor-related protein [Acidobacteriaceae bacterium]
MNPSPIHPLVAFYRDGARDDAGRTLAAILAWDDDRLESVHDFIQWLFPLPERSGANPSAPILDDATIAAFHATPVMRERLRASLDRMLCFYGFAWDSAATEPALLLAPNFPDRARTWLSLMNHNHLRLTRILRSTRLLGLAAESSALFAALDAIYREFPDRITPRTFAYWVAAADIS